MIRYGRFGKFIGCSDYPNCRHTEPFLERLGIACPVCGAEHGGEIIERRTKRGRVFYGCSRYPECEFTSWKKPLPQPCPNCGGLLVEQSRNKAQCTVCKHTYQIDKLPTRKRRTGLAGRYIACIQGRVSGRLEPAPLYFPTITCDQSLS